ncbi:hypothetical protein [Desulforhabdus sp. TSK]|uniref:hypothetical protein n=1 Tax=Desulforhabdus sp. TSK TaxID=2925014 RepID=UPI001FC84F48|nr:hypothetical protein [Desulforhabdus sp. TSK]GKT07009.1 hypothetical protein DSTSK_03140 [Desulforhabdus sp. TSK]
MLDDLLGSPYATIRNFNVASAMSGAILSAGNIEEGWKSRLLQLLNLENDYAVPCPAKRQDVVWLSDGGYSDNLGAYALLRRKCRTILIVDAGYDPPDKSSGLYKFDSYNNLKQEMEKDRDLGIEINVPIDAFTSDKPIMEGVTTENGKPYGKILYIKLSKHDSLLRDQAETINAYAKKDDKTKREFPHESTVDQYFDEDQFKAYRALGYAITRTLPNNVVI